MGKFDRVVLVLAFCAAHTGAFVVWPTLAHAADPVKETAFDGNKGITIERVRIGRHADKTRVVLDVSAPVNFDYQISEGGKTIVLLLPKVEWKAAQYLRMDRSRNIYRISFFPNRELGGGVLSILGRQRVGLSFLSMLEPTNDGGHRIVLDIPHDREMAKVPAGGVMRGGKIYPPHAEWPPLMQANQKGTAQMAQRGAARADESKASGSAAGAASSKMPKVSPYLY